MRTYVPKKEEVLSSRRWWLVDAKGQTLGRLASRVAKLLMGKHKPMWTPHLDCGDFVVVVNAEKVVLTGKKWHQKKYYHHSGYPGGLKVRTAAQIREKHPELLIREAVRRMLPKNRLGRAMLRKLKVYRGPEHPHHAQGPEPIDLGEV